LILTKGAGIEGTAILASEAYHIVKDEIASDLLDSAMKFYDKISVVKDAILAFNTGGVTAMHDPTEGGVLGGIHEMADAANLGVKVFEDKIPIFEETWEICRFFDIDPLQLIGSGALLISAEPGSDERIVRNLRDEGVNAEIIGEFLDDPKQRILMKSDGRIEKLTRPLSDHLWIALEKCQSKD